MRREDAAEAMENLVSGEWYLYAVTDLGAVDPGQAGFGQGRLQVVFGRDVESPPAALALSFSDTGFTSTRYPCGANIPEALMSPGRAPSFLLLPP